jgi:hypothetical protein
MSRLIAFLFLTIVTMLIIGGCTAMSCVAILQREQVLSQQIISKSNANQQLLDKLLNITMSEDRLEKLTKEERKAEQLAIISGYLNMRWANIVDKPRGKLFSNIRKTIDTATIIDDGRKNYLKNQAELVLLVQEHSKLIDDPISNTLLQIGDGNITKFQPSEIPDGQHQYLFYNQ